MEFSDSTFIIMISLAATGIFLLGVPVFLVIAFWVVTCAVVVDQAIVNVASETIFAFSKGFALLAMPLFILTGDLIAQSGIARRMANFAYAGLGWIRGGLGMATIGACGLFAAISGSNSATTATIGRMLHPELVKGGYDERFSAATSAAGGTVGIIIPPSIIFIVYGVLMKLPVSTLFLAGIIPGILMVIAMQFSCWIIARQNGWGHLLQFDMVRFAKTAFGSWLGFAAIGLVLWGIYTGKFSPTQAAGVTVGFCILVGLICMPLNRLFGDGREESDALDRSVWQMAMVQGFSLRQVPSITFRSAQITGVLAPLIAISILMQQILSDMGAKDTIEAFVTSAGGYYAVLLISMGIVYVTGMIIESLPVTIILAPILAPIAQQIGIDPIHFAVVFLVGASIGFITPPYGLNLYVASGVTGVPYFRLLRYTIPYLLALLFVWFVVAFVPQLSTILTHCAEGAEVTANCYTPAAR